MAVFVLHTESVVYYIRTARCSSEGTDGKTRRKNLAKMFGASLAVEVRQTIGDCDCVWTAAIQAACPKCKSPEAVRASQTLPKTTGKFSDGGGLSMILGKVRLLRTIISGPVHPVF